MFVKLFICLSLFIPAYTQWTTCEELDFCTTLRYNLYHATYSLANIEVADEITGNIVNDQSLESLNFRFAALEGDTFRFTVQDADSSRYTPAEDALQDEPVKTSFSVGLRNDSLIRLNVGEVEVILFTSPFKIEVYRNSEQIIVINGDNRLIINNNDENKALALDISFPNAQRAYGIPQHAERLSLPSTGPGGLSAFRHFNVDYYGFPAFTRESLYGAIGVLYGISTSITSGIFWMNAAQTFIDISSKDDGVSSLFISETGALELFLFAGPTLKDCVRQYTTLTGVGQLPQYYNLGYHQSRYSYMSQEDVETVVAEFDNHDFPMDVIWLDIDYTYGYRYFTWNLTAFPDPVAMQNNVVNTGRKMVAIIDPHIKVEEGYFVYDQGIEYGFFVKNPNGTVFEGECWPGLSSYVDYLDPKAQEWYGNLYLLEQWNHTTLNLFVWNDMNEPSVFELQDQTMPLDLPHYGGWEHRDIHNIYGFKHTESTRGGLLRRDSTQRPFVLTRSHFAGSQRFAAMWTGDNQPTWEHLQVSIPMVLTENLAGMAFCGADVGGFIDNVEDELLQRWYQVGAWYPFYRGHSGANTDRREPYLFSEEIQAVIREAMRIRYRHIPYWYTLFFEHELTGDPIVRPLSYQYPEDTAVLDIDDQLLIGDNIMAAPVVYKGVSSITTYFPGGSLEYWYDINNMLVYPGVGNFDIAVDMNSAPYYYRGGSIILRLDDDVRSTQGQPDGGYTIYICLDSNSEAFGNFYLDDLTSFDYKNQRYHYYRFEYTNGVLSAEEIHEDASFDDDFVINRIVLYSVPSLKSGIQAPKLTTLDQNISIGQESSKLTLSLPIN